MTPPVMAFLATFVGFLLVGMHSIWRFVVRSQLPSLIHAGNAALATYSAWLVFLGDVASNPGKVEISTPAIGLLAWAWCSVIAIHLYELRQRMPYDGLFPRWKK